MSTCFQCRYPLEGIRAAVCPECGWPTAYSARHSALERAETVGALGRALGSMRLWMIVTVACYLPSIVAALLLRLEGMSLLFDLLGTVAGVFYTIAVWKLTSTSMPAMTDAPNHWPGSARALARVGCVAGVTVSVVSLGAQGRPNPALIVAGLGAVVVTSIGVMMCLRAIARMVPDRRLHDRAGVYVWLIPVLNTVGMLLLLLGPFVAAILEAHLLGQLRQRVDPSARWRPRNGFRAPEP